MKTQDLETVGVVSAGTIGSGIAQAFAQARCRIWLAAIRREPADFIGLDVCGSALRVLQQGLGDPKHRPIPPLVRMMDGGLLGRESGRRCYDCSILEGRP